ncbi:MAG: hypothetical protein KF764_25505 [Labilithrix sp.]|nr:hypothetical protein [Labilithrix sp.]
MVTKGKRLQLHAIGPLLPHPRAVRAKLGLSMVVVAARAGVALSTLRLFEADIMAVSVDSRRRLGAVYAELLGELRSKNQAVAAASNHT